MEIDPRMQQAAVASLESQRASRQADLQYAQQQAARMKTLLEAGAASQAELEQAQTGALHQPRPSSRRPRRRSASSAWPSATTG